MEVKSELSQALVEHCASHVVVIDESGNILYVNAAWIRFSQENKGPLEAWVGQSYFDVCQRSIESGDTSAALALHGIKEVVEGKRKDFTLEYPCHSPEERRWFLLRALLLPESGQPLVAIYHDRFMSESELRQAKERLALAADAGQIGIWEYDLETHKLNWDHWMYRIYGLSPGQFNGERQLWLNCVHEDDRRRLESDLKQALSTHQPLNSEFRIVRPSGEIRHLVSRAQVSWDQAGFPRHLTGISLDVTDLRQAEEQMVAMAFQDPLTGLPNRILFMDRLRQAIKISQRGRSFGALFYIDLDNFKRINDTCGHNGGDELLRVIAARLKHDMRDEDTLCRIGGDEFVLLTPELSPDDTLAARQASLLAGKINAAVQHPITLARARVMISGSVGIALVDGATDSAETLLMQADLAMYKAKGKGRNTNHFYDAQLQNESRRRRALEKGLRAALDRGDQLQIHYQPQVLENLTIVGAEALLRWQHPGLGPVPPEEFIPIAEDCGLIEELGDWVFNQTCSQLAAWARQLLPIKIAVNLSARQFHQTGCLAKMRKSMKAWHVEASSLKLELTESILLENTEDAIENMKQMQLSGLQLVLDDFGTGYSSLSYLKRLPLSTFKIDRSFVRDILTNADDAAIAQTIMTLADAMGLDVIAEGVETKAQMTLLSEMGCHCFQGFLFQPALPAEDFERVLRDPEVLLTEMI
ncbi:EAL domain-containing protein [Allohahella sp. A8]|uniref:EAL domain-containing protein n=1 Tax=Allohahella sp. A8 TaxID=3141461 RepID=UPI003A7F80BF